MTNDNNIFDTIIGLAPLLGLLATILGLIASFAFLNIGDIMGCYNNSWSHQD